MKTIRRGPLALIAVLVIALACLILSTMVPEPANAGGRTESWKKAHAIPVAAADTLAYKVAWLGNDFNAKKLTISALAGADQTITVTSYFPLSAGPVTATDSTVYRCHGRAIGVHVATFYVTVSDSILILAGSSSVGDVYLFGD